MQTPLAQNWTWGVIAFAGKTWSDDLFFQTPAAVAIDLTGLVMRVRVGPWNTGVTLWEGLSTTALSGVSILDQSVPANIGKGRIDVPLASFPPGDLRAEIVLMSASGTIAALIAGRIQVIPLMGPKLP